MKIPQNTRPVMVPVYSSREIPSLFSSVIVPIFVIEVVKKIRLDFPRGLDFRYHL